MFTSARTFRVHDLNRLTDSFQKIVDRVLHENEPLTENLEILLVNAYNSIIRYTATDFSKRKEKTRKLISNTITDCRKSLRKCEKKLNVKIYLPSYLLSPISTSDYPRPPTPTPPVPSPTPPNHQNIQPTPPVPSPRRHISISVAPIMADFTYLTNLKSILNKTYDREPSGLSAFIEAMAAELSQPAQIATLIRFIKTKCEKTAKEAINELETEPNTVAHIVAALQKKIKVENSKVVLGRLLALKADKTSVQNFQEKGEELAEKLRLAYISDGIPATVAKEMVIDKTVEMCRSSAKSW